MRNNESAIVVDEQRDNSLQNTAHEVHDLVNRIRSTMARRNDWEQTARLVADELKGKLPSPDILTFQQRLGDPDHYCSLPLHVEPNGSFSIVALVWRPGQETPIHDHVAWCVFGVIQGVEYEELYLKDDGGCLIEAGVNYNPTGSESCRSAGRYPPCPQRRRFYRHLDPYLWHRRSQAGLQRPS